MPFIIGQPEGDLNRLAGLNAIDQSRLDAERIDTFPVELYGFRTENRETHLNVPSVLVHRNDDVISRLKGKRPSVVQRAERIAGAG